MAVGGRRRLYPCEEPASEWAGDKDEVGNVLSGEIIQNGKTQDGTDLTPDRSYQLDYQPMKLTLEAGSFG